MIWANRLRFHFMVAVMLFLPSTAFAVTITFVEGIHKTRVGSFYSSLVDAFFGFQPDTDPMGWTLMTFDGLGNLIASVSTSTAGPLDWVPSTFRVDAPGRIASIQIARNADFVIDTITFGPSISIPVPEPTTLLPLSVGLAGLEFTRRRLSSSAL